MEGNGLQRTPEAMDDPFISQIGELPKFNSTGAFDRDADVSSDAGSVPFSDISDSRFSSNGDLTKSAQKAIVTKFVQEMVKGKEVEVVILSGERVMCFCKLSRALDVIKVKVAGHERSIPLLDVENIAIGADVKEIEISTPVDDLCVSLMQVSGDCISFRLPDMDSRDTFAKSIHVFRDKLQSKLPQQQPAPSGSKAKVKKAVRLFVAAQKITIFIVGLLLLVVEWNGMDAFWVILGRFAHFW